MSGESTVRDYVTLQRGLTYKGVTPLGSNSGFGIQHCEFVYRMVQKVGRRVDEQFCGIKWIRKCALMSE